jgi:hypothetical protein
MVHLLTVHKVKMDNLRFVDVIGKFAADTKAAPASVSMADGPFHIDRLTSSFSQLADDANGSNGGMGCRYLIIDNLASLLAFNNLSAVSIFLNGLVRFSNEKGEVLIPLILDSQKSAALYETARGLCRDELHVRASCELPQAGTGSVGPKQAKET